MRRGRPAVQADSCAVAMAEARPAGPGPAIRAGRQVFYGPTSGFPALHADFAGVDRADQPHISAQCRLTLPRSSFPRAKVFKGRGALMLSSAPAVRLGR